MQQSFYVVTGILAIASFALAGENATERLDINEPTVPAASTDLWTGEGVSLGGILFPHVHLNSAFGTSTSDDIVDQVAIGHHDPNREGFTMQNLELGTSLRLGEYLEGFATYAAVVDLDDEWSGGWEEAFLKVKSLPGGFELRGGRYFNRFGFYNAVHPHGYFFVDKDLLEGRILGEDSLATEGGEITWRLPTPFTSALSYSFGTAVVEGHGDEHEKEEEPPFEAEGAAFSNDLHNLHWLAKWDYNDFHQFSGHLSAAWGDNAFARDTSAYTVGVEYLWRENGYEPGGRHLRWRTAAMMRDINAISGHLPGEEEEEEELHEEEDEHHEEDEHEEEEARSASLSEWGLSSSLHYGWNDSLETGLGVAWVEGIAPAGLDERLRLSPVMTFRPTRNTNLKLQYNFDRLSGNQDEHSVWLGFGFNWGGGEVR
ncbi:MAG: hypothetical protein O3C21_11285 [Verrucomicrobia bacterium]|nr:hypothetical protein [Verrucomicrobiota bacterium]